MRSVIQASRSQGDADISQSGIRVAREAAAPPQVNGESRFSHDFSRLPAHADPDSSAKQGPSPAAGGQRSRIWASQQESRGSVCEVPSPAPGNRGQSGFNIGINYSTLPHLVGEMRRRLGGGRAERISIECHGTAGSAEIEGAARPHLTATRLDAALRGSATLTGFDIATGPPYSLPHYTGVVNGLRSIAQLLDPGSSVLFVGCLAGGGREGVDLLRLLSSARVFNCNVVGFTTTTAALGGAQLRPGSACTEPGTRVTNQTSPALPGAAPVGDPSARDYSGQQLPWADENAPHARIASPNGTVYDRDTRQTLAPTQNAPDLPDPDAPSPDSFRGWPDPTGRLRAAEQAEAWRNRVRQLERERWLRRHRRNRRPQ